MKKMHTNSNTLEYGMITDVIFLSLMARMINLMREIVKKMSPDTRRIPIGMKKNVNDHASLSADVMKQLLNRGMLRDCKKQTGTLTMLHQGRSPSSQRRLGWRLRGKEIPNRSDHRLPSWSISKASLCQLINLRRKSVLKNVSRG